ncbi:MAG: ATP-dependent zinc metalloprotease FtsH [Eubacteriales bacterium]
MKKNRSNIITIVFYFILIGLIIFAIASLFAKNDTEKPMYSDIIRYFNNEQVKELYVENNNLTIVLRPDAEHAEERTITYSVRDNYTFENDLGELIIKQVNSGKIEKYENVTKETPWIVSYIPYIILLVLFVVFMVFTMRQTNGGGKMGSFGKSKIRNVQNQEERVLFSDVAGADEEKEELEEVVQYLKNPSRFTRLGAKIPHGVLLVGPPGTGKTLLAKAVAGEAGVPFYSMSGSDFVEMYVGVGASRVRDLFDTARKSPAAIIFIDEIDAVGRQRGAGLGGGHDEREQTLNQLLVEMDGFDGHSGIIVMAATNRPDILDSALLRPGRFDRQVTVGYPDMQGREDILKVHSKNKPFEENVDLHKIAQTTVGFTGADLANLLNESALLAARKGKNLIGMTEIEDAMIKITVGTQKKAKKMSEKERKNTAVHESGHAIVSHILPSQDPVRQISIIPSGRALGYTLTPPVEDKYSESKQEMKERIAMMLGGRVAEQIVFGDYTGGASNDIMRATEVARKMVTVYGMSDELGTIHFGSQHDSDEVFLGRDFNSTPDYSDSTAAKIDAEIKKIVDESYNMAYDILTKHRDKIDFITSFLLRHEVMDDEQFALAMKDGVTMEEVENLVTEKKRRSEEENKRRAKELEEERQRARAERERLEKELGLYDGDDDAYLPEGQAKDAPEEADAPEDKTDSGNSDNSSDEAKSTDLENSDTDSGKSE